MPKKPETKTSTTKYHFKDSEITESSKVIISRIYKQNQTNQTSTSKSSSTTAQTQQNQTNTNSKQSKQIVISDRLRDLMIQFKITTYLDSWQMMLTWIPTRVRYALADGALVHCHLSNSRVVSSLYYFNKRSST